MCQEKDTNNGCPDLLPLSPEENMGVPVSPRYFKEMNHK